MDDIKTRLIEIIRDNGFLDDSRIKEINHLLKELKELQKENQLNKVILSQREGVTYHIFR